MKKFFLPLLTLLLVFSVFSTVALAKTVDLTDDYAEDASIVFASFNGAKPFLSGLNNVETLEEACYWITDYAELLNIKYVSFLGKLTSDTYYIYDRIVLQDGKTQAELNAANATDETRLAEYEGLRKIGNILTRQGIPYGVSLHLRDYYANGFNRGNLLANEFIVDDFIGDSDVTAISYDTNNFATIIESNGASYIVYQLEAYPKQAVVNWFNNTNAQHLDKRAFVFTTSFADANGDMYTQYDPTKHTFTNAPDKGNSTLTSNMVWTGTPYDGNQLWNYALGLHDNIVLIMSANPELGTEIVTKTFKNTNGYTVVSAVANLIKGYETAGAYPILIKFSEENKTLDLRYAVPYHNVNGGYIEESVVTITLDKLAPLPEPDPMTLLPKIPAQYNGANKSYINGYEGNIFKPNANMTKAEASTIFARLLTGSTTLPTGNSTRFLDVKEGDWYYDAIAYLDTNYFYNSYESDKYLPNTPITRGEFVELAYLASNLVVGHPVKFKDVDETHKYYDAIMAAAASGLINGYEDSTFRPDATITRAEVVTIINRLLSLVVSNQTIDKEHLTNTFKDISGHWAELQVLMASNSNVHGKNFYEIDPSIFTESAGSIWFENKQLKVGISKKNGKVTDLVYVPTGESVLASSTTPWFAYLTTSSGAVLSPNSVELVDGRLKTTFKGGYEVYFIIDVKDNYFSIELDSNLPKELSYLSFGTFAFDYIGSQTDEDTFRASGLSMDTKAVLQTAPGGLVTHTTKANVYNMTGTGVTKNNYVYVGIDTMGAKYAVAFSKMDVHRDILKEITDDIDPSRGIKSTMGGAYGLDQPELKEDYAITHSVYPSNAEAFAKTFNTFNIEVIDLHYGTTFTTGDFNFIGSRTEEESKNGTFVDAATFKERVTDVFNSYGVDIAIHTYCQGIDPKATGILSDPKWQKQLLYNPETYTLRGDLSKYRVTVKTYEDASKYTCSSDAVAYSSSEQFTQYLLIDEEIIRVTKGRGTSSGFMQVSRGQLGTKAAEHKDGAEIKQLVGLWSTFQPIPGSELYYHIADNTAKAYNESGATMIYLDAQDGMHSLIEGDRVNYYKTEFIRRILSQCNTDPIIESAAWSISMWQAGGRAGAVDVTHRNIKARTKGHYQTYVPYYDQMYYGSNMGWYAFDPDGSSEFKNTYAKTIFRDDLDYLGAITLASDCTMVPNGVSSTLSPKGNTRYADNLLYYGVYARLRKADYFSEEVKEIIKNGKYEYRLIEQEDGSFAFKEMYYDKHKIYSLEGLGDVTGEGNNPFGSQTPFVRIEHNYSTNGENEIVLVEIDESKDVSSVKGAKTIKATNISGNNVLKVNVLGNGKDGAILISLDNGSGGHADYFITTSHTGWKEFVLGEVDNGEYTVTGHSFAQADTSWANYPTYHNSADFTRISRVQIGVSGDVSGVKIDDIKAYKVFDAPVKNPTVKIGSSTMTFETVMNSGDFIEYYPDENKAYHTYYDESYDEEGKYTGSVYHTKEISFSGKLTVNTGKFTYTYSAEPTTDAPTRARVVIGTQGGIIANPADWVAPEVDMGLATLDVVIK